MDLFCNICKRLAQMAKKVNGLDLFCNVCKRLAQIAKKGKRLDLFCLQTLQNKPKRFAFLNIWYKCLIKGLIANLYTNFTLI